jgi:hypothetical protein
VQRHLDIHAYVDGAQDTRLLAAPFTAVVVEPAGTATAVVALRMDAAQAQRYAGRVAVPIRLEVVDGAGPRAGKASSASTFIAPVNP